MALSVASYDLVRLALAEFKEHELPVYPPFEDEKSNGSDEKSVKQNFVLEQFYFESSDGIKLL